MLHAQDSYFDKKAEVLQVISKKKIKVKIMEGPAKFEEKNVDVKNVVVMPTVPAADD